MFIVRTLKLTVNAWLDKSELNTIQCIFDLHLNLSIP